MIYLYAFGYCISLAPIVWLYPSEIMPAKIACSGYISIYFWGTILQLVFPIMQLDIKIYGCFFLFASVCFIGLFISHFSIIETKGKTKDEIE